MPDLTPEDVEALFTRSDESFAFSRWGRPIVPVVFGVEDATLSVIKGAIEAVVAMAGHKMAETDPELGANLMVFFMRDWQELLDTPNLDRLVPELPDLVARLQAAEANQYRIFRFDEQGAIQACFVFLRMDAVLSEMPADTLALSQVVQSVLLWSDRAFHRSSPLALLPDSGTAVLRPEIAAVIRAAYDPVLPAHADTPAHALRLYARLQARPQS
ncbi:hypothetical protein PSA7680_03290 [Pseudoruegeria aquimaris]|uniref:Uncharacterized protein n=1 Tax=Pseudoruegeria aquimaris TaxID=393663 RepID=A0A1Y5TET2_9RHOB|nr:hypothetical protein [Pseudoruegeria aquimaris]SLN62491.1 hypothetical protein PSA7680_03290 [Pseudoruegeria aquimaris]